MFKKALCPVMSVIVLMVPVAVWGASSAGNVSIDCTVEKFFQWPSSMSVTVPNITGVSQTKSVVQTFTCYMNHSDAVTIQASDGGDGKAGQLTEGGSSKTLVTKYGISGTGILAADRDAEPANGTSPATLDWANAGSGFSEKTYNIDTEAPGSFQVKLAVSATSDADPNNVPPGNYTCIVTLTASF